MTEIEDLRAALRTAEAERDRYRDESASAYDVGFRDGNAWPKETAEKWEYGVAIDRASAEAGFALPWKSRNAAEVWIAARPYHPEATVLRRQAPGAWEPLPPTPETKEPRASEPHPFELDSQAGECRVCGRLSHPAPTPEEAGQ